MKQHPMQQKIESVLSQLNHGLVEREHILKTALLTLLAGENLVLIGPPGTGKSLVARRLTKAFALGGEQEGGYFEYLLTKFSTPEEIFEVMPIALLMDGAPALSQIPQLVHALDLAQAATQAQAA